VRRFFYLIPLDESQSVTLTRMPIYDSTDRRVRDPIDSKIITKLLTNISKVERINIKYRNIVDMAWLASRLLQYLFIFLDFDN